MRRVINLLITMLILFLSSVLFPANVRIEGFWNLLLVAFLIWALSAAIAYAIILIFAVGVLFENAAWVIVSFVALLFTNVIAILLLSRWMSSFYVSGFWMALLLSVVISLFSLSSPERRESY